jgi:Ca2+-binding EF-hand superfamily protein
MPLDRKMNILELRYKEFGDSRVNYLSLLYDMYCLRSNWNSDGKDSDGGDNTLPEFLDFPHQKTPKRDDEIRKIMANFSFIMKKKEITSEAMVGEMVDMARSHSIRNSVILLKVIDIMEEELFKDSANMNMGASMLSNNSRTNKSDENYRHPLLSVFEIVDCLDIDNQGSILDYDIVHRLNNLLNSDLIDFSSKLLNAMETNNCHLEMLIDKTIVENRNVNLSKLKDVLQLKADIHPDLTQKMFKTISIAHLDEIPLDSLKTKLDREICILGQERPEVVKQYIYGPQASGHITADGIGVGDLIRQLHLNMERQKKTFKEVFFRDPTRRKMPKEEFKTIYQQFIVGQHSELEKLLKKITDNQNKTMIDLNILEAIYNSKYGKVVAEDPASLTVETTLKNLRQTVAIFGHSAITLFNSADSNASNSLDREEFFALLLRLDDTIKREETNLIFDKTDDDRSGSINFKEFEQLFNVNSKVLGQKLRVDAIKWAKDIFEEINTKLQDTG